MANVQTPKVEHVFTTGQTAKLCRVAPRTVSGWFDNKSLKGYRIPGSQDRRIPQVNLVEFMKAAEMPLGGLREFLRERGCKMTGFEVHAVFVGFDAFARTQFESVIKTHTMHFCDTTFDAGSLVSTLIPDVVVVDHSLGSSYVYAVGRSVRSNERYADIQLIAVGGEDGLGTLELTLAGYDAVLFRPLDFDLIARSIATGTVKSKGGA